MNLFYSKIQPETLLHILCRVDHDRSKPRMDLTPETEGLQVAYLNLEKDQTFKPHKHLPRERSISRTQESWIVIRGIVDVIYYDLDDSILDALTLHPGDLTITLMGGHNYVSRTNDTLVVECKTGPFIGVNADKALIDSIG